jgi:hypothetical protein
MKLGDSFGNTESGIVQQFPEPSAMTDKIRVGELVFNILWSFVEMTDTNTINEVQ